MYITKRYYLANAHHRWSTNMAVIYLQNKVEMVRSLDETVARFFMPKFLRRRHPRQQRNKSMNKTRKKAKWNKKKH